MSINCVDVSKEMITSKNCLKRLLKIYKTKVLMKSVTSEGRKYCRMLHWSICNTFDLHYAIIGIANQFFAFFLSDRLRQVLLYL